MGNVRREIKGLVEKTVNTLHVLSVIVEDELKLIHQYVMRLVILIVSSTNTSNPNSNTCNSSVGHKRSNLWWLQVDPGEV